MTWCHSTSPASATSHLVGCGEGLAVRCLGLSTLPARGCGWRPNALRSRSRRIPLDPLYHSGARGPLPSGMGVNSPPLFLCSNTRALLPVGARPDASSFRRTPGTSLGILSFSREAPGFRHGECHGAIQGGSAGGSVGRSGSRAVLLAAGALAAGAFGETVVAEDAVGRRASVTHVKFATTARPMSCAAAVHTSYVSRRTYHRANRIGNASCNATFPRLPVADMRITLRSV